MELTATQLGRINIVLQLRDDGQARQFPLSELIIANDIYKKMKECSKDEQFIDGKVDFTSEEKVFISKLINQRNWALADAEQVFELQKLLK